MYVEHGELLYCGVWKINSLYVLKTIKALSQLVSEFIFSLSGNYHSTARFHRDSATLLGALDVVLIARLLY